MLRRRVLGSTLLIMLAALAGSATAQPAGFLGPVFRVEPEPRSDHARPGFVRGWVYNGGEGVTGLVRMRVEMLDGSGKVVAQHIGWAYGNVPPGRSVEMNSMTICPARDRVAVLGGDPRSFIDRPSSAGASSWYSSYGWSCSDRSAWRRSD